MSEPRKCRKVLCIRSQDRSFMLMEGHRYPRVNLVQMNSFPRNIHLPGYYK